MTLPDMTPVDSSNVASIGHDASTQTLYVAFLDGSTYAYESVDEDTFSDLRDAPSVGSYLNRVIKPHHPFQKL